MLSEIKATCNNIQYYYSNLRKTYWKKIYQNVNKGYINSFLFLLYTPFMLFLYPS